MSSGFVTENEIEERRKKRQEEWERVRKEEDPVEAPEEPFDSRSLFDRLQEQKEKKQSEWDESHKLKNQVRTIDCDEADFLDQVDAFRMGQEKERMKEEKMAIEEYRRIQEKLFEEELEERKKKELTVALKKPSQTSSVGSKQSKLLSGVIVRKRNSESDAIIKDDAKKFKDDDDTKGKINDNDKQSNDDANTSKEDVENVSKTEAAVSTVKNLGALAGLGDYSSDDSDDDTVDQ